MRSTTVSLESLDRPCISLSIPLKRDWLWDQFGADDNNGTMIPNDRSFSRRYDFTAAGRKLGKGEEDPAASRSLG